MKIAGTFASPLQRGSDVWTSKRPERMMHAVPDPRWDQAFPSMQGSALQMGANPQPVQYGFLAAPWVECITDEMDLGSPIGEFHVQIVDAAMPV